MRVDDGNGDGINRMNGRKPDGELQVSTDGWRTAMVSFERRPQPPESRASELRGRELRGLSPERVLGVTPEQPLAVLLVTGEKAVDLELSTGHTRTIPEETEHLYIREDFITALAEAMTLDVRFARADSFSAGAAMPEVRKLVEGTRTHYTCPQRCTWSETRAGDFGAEALVFHDGTIGVQFLVEAGALVGMRWLNRQSAPLSASSLKDRALTRARLTDGPWFIGGHPLVRQTHPA